MDPNATLADLRHQMEIIGGNIANGSEEDPNVIAAFELFEALDEWMSKCKGNPTAWPRAVLR